MSLIPTDDKLRKMLPMFSQNARYFPKAQREITKVSVVNNVRYNPGRAPNDINWARAKSPLQLDSAYHHMLEHEVDGKIFDEVPPEVQAATGIDRIYILAQAAWRISAELELLIEKVEAEEHAAANLVPVPSPLANDSVPVFCNCAQEVFHIHHGDLSPLHYKQGEMHSVSICEDVGGKKIPCNSRGVDI